MRAQATVGIALALWAISCDQARVEVRYHATPPLTLSMLSLQVTAAGEGWEFTGPESLPGGNRVFTTGRIPTALEGTLTVAFALRRPSGDTLSYGSASVPLRSDLGWGFEIMPFTTDPADLCFGCAGSIAFALDTTFRATGRDSVWLTWGGNSIKHPVIY